MPMSADELWKFYTAKNPHWLERDVTFTPAGLEKFFRQTFDLGHRLGLDEGKDVAKNGREVLDQMLAKIREGRR